MVSCVARYGAACHLDLCEPELTAPLNRDQGAARLADGAPVDTTRPGAYLSHVLDPAFEPVAVISCRLARLAANHKARRTFPNHHFIDHGRRRPAPTSVQKC
jgi:hypothetical protein